jgi:hypothetical protein
MTAKERDILDQLRTDVHGYHSDVKAHMATCAPYFQRVDRHSLDLYGNPEDREGNPGLMAEYADLKKGRKILLSVVAGAWTIATILLGTLVSRWF